MRLHSNCVRGRDLDALEIFTEIVAEIAAEIVAKGRLHWDCRMLECCHAARPPTQCMASD